MRYFGYIFNIVKKDIVTESRAKESVSAMLVFGLLVIVVFSFAFNLDSGEQVSLAPGLLWVAFTFSGILGLNHSFAAEGENNCLQGIMLAPVPRTVIYLGKLISNIIFMLFSELVIFILFIWLFDVRFTGRWHLLILPFVLGTSGFAIIGTLFSGISIGSRMRTFLLPILQLPITIPVLIFSVEATAVLLKAENTIGYFDWIKLLFVFNIIFLTISILLFEYILEE
ncbi:heme exporter protein CcmB [candidate division KSB1 bacterium]